MKRMILFAIIAVMMALVACNGSSTAPNKENTADSISEKTETEPTKTQGVVPEVQVETIKMNIEKSIQADLLSGVVLCLDQIILDKRRFTTLEESDKFVKLSKELVEKYKDRIQKLIDQE